MPLQNFQYDIIMREYSRRQSQVQNELEEHRKEAFQKVPFPKGGRKVSCSSKRSMTRWQL